MRELPDEAQEFAFRHYPALRLSLPYVSIPLRQKLLALYGLLANVEESVCRASDPVVARARLAWWLQELQQARHHTGNHPLSKHLQSSGALGDLPEELLGRLIVSTENRLDLTGLRDEASLKELCEGLGAIQLELELALVDGADSEFPGRREFVAMNGMVQLLRESFRSRQASYSWVPLTLCAKFEVSRQSLSANPGAAKCNPLFAGLADLSLRWLPDRGSMDSIFKQVPDSWRAGNVHWLIMTNLQKRQLLRIRKGIQQGHAAESGVSAFEKPRVFDAWSTWRLVHRFKAGRVVP